jgi:hypothetical protein
MFSRLASRLRRTAAWRLSGLTAVAFGAGTGAALLGAFLVVEQGIRARSDGWLVGESLLLTEVYSQTPPGALHATLMEEVAELAAHEVLPADGGTAYETAPVFFLVLSNSGTAEVWVGPEDRDPFVAAVRNRTHPPSPGPFGITVPGWPSPFRVAGHMSERGEQVFLGFIDENAEALLARLRRTFLWLWGGMLLFGFGVSFLSTRQVLLRVERVTETAARVGRAESGQRVPTVSGRDVCPLVGGT